jgi:hypothetical protein
VQTDVKMATVWINLKAVLSLVTKSHGFLTQFFEYRFAVFSLEPLAQDPRESEVTDMRSVNLLTPLLFCPNRSLKISYGDRSLCKRVQLDVTIYRFILAIKNLYMFRAFFVHPQE